MYSKLQKWIKIYNKVQENRVKYISKVQKWIKMYNKVQGNVQ